MKSRRRVNSTVRRLDHEMKRPLQTYAGFAQLICGFAVFVLGLWIWWHRLLIDQSNGKKFDSDEAFFLLFVVGPGVFVVLGSLGQVVYRRVWPLALVLIGGGAILWVVVLAVGSLLAYYGPTSDLRLVRADIVFLLITLAASLWNAIIELALRFSNTGGEQIVGRERRERVSHHDSSGDA